MVFIRNLIVSGLFLATLASPLMGAENLLKDPRFTTESSVWHTSQWQEGVVYTRGENYRGQTADAVIESGIPNDARWEQKLSVKPGRVYTFKAMAAAEGIDSTNSGASICVMNTFVSSAFIKGTTGWSPVSFSFKTGPKDREVVIAARLGFYGAVASGKAYFKDLEIYEDPYAQNAQTVQTPEPQKAEQPARPATPFSILKLYPLLVLIYVAALIILLSWRHEKKFWPQAKLPAGADLALVLLAGLLIRLPLLGQAPFQTDMDCFYAWALRMVETGPFNFYDPNYFCDYPPFPLYILGIFGGIVKLLGLSGAGAYIVLKIPALLTDGASAFVIYRLLEKKSRPLAVIAAAAYFLMPAVVYNSAYWGQVDSYYALLMLLVFSTALKRQWVATFAILAASLFTKTQTIAFFPILGLLWLLKTTPREKALSAASALGTALLILLPVIIGRGPEWVISYFTGQAGYYPYASFNAGNFLSFISGNQVTDSTPVIFGLPYMALGIILYIISMAATLVWYFIKPGKARLTAVFFLSSLLFFMVFPRMHERYLFPALLFGVISAAWYRDRLLAVLSGLLSLSFLINLHAVVLKYLPQPLLGEDTFQRVMIILGLFNTALTITILIRFALRSGIISRRLRLKIRNTFQAIAQAYTPAGKPFAVSRKDLLILGSIVAFAACLYFFRLGSTQVPVKGLMMNSKNAVITAEFDQPVTIGSVAWYDGEGQGTVTINGMTAAGPQTLGQLNTVDYYVMKSQGLTAVPVTMVQITPDPVGGKILEIAFFDTTGRLLEPARVKDLRYTFSRGTHPLFDEQSLMMQKPDGQNSTYFDEIYHGRTAYEFVTRSQVYETTHPPLGKTWLSLGIRLFGMTPFGMRSFHALSGLILLVLLFFLGRELLKDRLAAFMTTLIGLFDFMPFVQSRYATIDTTSAASIVLMALIALRWYRAQTDRENRTLRILLLLLTGAAFGMAAAVKWTAIYGGPALAVIVLVGFYQSWKTTAPKKKEAFLKQEIIPVALAGISGAAVLAGLIYILSYIPFLQANGSTSGVLSADGLHQIILAQRDMYLYHKNLDATHSFSSPWWGWPFDFKPLWIFMGTAAQGMKMSIATLGNPFIWWGALLAFMMLVYRFIFGGRPLKSGLIILLALSFYLPWVTVPRIMFIYHFYPVLPFLYVTLAGALAALYRSGKAAKAGVIAFAGLCVLLWIWFYPLLSGLEVPEGWIRSLQWFPKDWWF